MTLSIIRKEAPEDRQRVNAAARRFCERHNILITNADAQIFANEMEGVIAYHITYGVNDPAEKSTLQRKWAQAMCRALRVKYDRRVTLAYGHVGISID